MGLVVLGLIALQNYVYNKLWDKRLSLDIRFSAKEAFEGDSLILHEELTNNKFLPLPWVFVKFHVSKNLVFEGSEEQSISDAHYQSDLFSIMMYQSIRRKMNFVCSKRGYYRIRNANLLCTNLLYSSRFNKRMDSTAELTVFPKLLNDHEEIDVIYRNLDAKILSNSLINPDPFEFRGIREYQPTDRMRDINFKASAVAQQLMVNIHAPTSSKRLEIILNLEYNRQYPEFELYEQSIRLVATLAERYINEGVKLGLYTNGKDTFSSESIRVQAGSGPSHMYAIFQALAHVGLTFKAGHMAPHLNNLQEEAESPAYLIVSPYCQQDFLDAVESMKNRGLSTFVVVPIQKSMDADINIAETDDMRIWEAL